MRSSLVTSCLLAALGCGSSAPPPRAPAVVEAPIERRAPPPAPPARPRLPARSADVAISLEGERIAIGGAPFPIEPKVSDFETVFGKADRVTELVYRIHTWDRLGVIVHEPYDGRATSVTFELAAEKFKFAASEPFDGALVVDGKRLDRRAIFDDVTTWPGTKRDKLGSVSATSERGAISVFVSGPDGPQPIRSVVISFYKKASNKMSAEGLRRGEAECRAGNASRCAALAVVLNSEGEVARAFDLARLGCDGDDTLACTTLGLMYLEGKTAPRSRDLANKAYGKACKLGEKFACTLIKP